MKNQITINIAKDFSPFPSGRFIKMGPYSGEEFRETLLKDALKNFHLVIVELDGAEGYNSSFLEEAFGGIIRKKYLDKAEIKDRLQIVAIEDAYKHYQTAIYRYLEKARPENG